MLARGKGGKLQSLPRPVCGICVSPCLSHIAVNRASDHASDHRTGESDGVCMYHKGDIGLQSVMSMAQEHGKALRCFEVTS